MGRDTEDRPSRSGLPVRGRPRETDGEAVGIVAVDSALEVLDVLVSLRAGTSLSELCRLTGMQPSKLHRYLVSFVRAGMVTQDEATGFYDLGPMAFRMGVAALNRFDGMALAQESVGRITAQTGLTTSLYIWTELGPMLIRTAHGTDNAPVTFRLGSTLPICGSATGRLFYAYLPREVVQPLVDRECQSAAREGIELLDDGFHAEIERIRAARVYSSAATVLLGSVVVAPILNRDGELECALTLVIPRGSGAPHRVGELEQLMADARARIEAQWA